MSDMGMKHIASNGKDDWWESDDQKNWRRISDAEAKELLNDVQEMMGQAMDRIERFTPPAKRRRRPKDIITEADIKKFEAALAKMPSVHAPEDDKLEK